MPVLVFVPFIDPALDSVIDSALDAALSDPSAP